MSCQLIRRVSLRPWAENQEPPPRPSPSPPPASSGPAEAFQFTPKNRERLNITALGLPELSDILYRGAGWRDAGEVSPREPRVTSELLWVT